MPDYRRTFDEIDASLRLLDIDQIKQRLESLMIGYSIESPIFDSGAFLYRARKIGLDFSKAVGVTRKDLIYPPKGISRRLAD